MINAQTIGHIVANGAALLDGISKEDVQPGGSISNIVDIAAPLLNKTVPGVAAALPIIKNVLLPMAEGALTTDEADKLSDALRKIEDGLEASSAAAAKVKRDVDRMSTEDLYKFADVQGNFRD